jgi:hypothetical protein
MILLIDLEEFVRLHRPHGALTGDATEPASNGYLLTVACPCGVVFERWVPRRRTLRWISCARICERVRTENLGQMTDRLGRLLLVTLEATRVNADLPMLGALRSWLDSWRGIGDVERGMARQGFDLQLTRYDEKGWRATFYTTGMEHSITSATASAWERTPWHAVQGAARDALRQANRHG